MKKKINIFAFSIIISVFCASYLANIIFSQSYSFAQVQSAYVRNIMVKDEFIDVYGVFQRILGKNAIENFTLFKNDYDKIVSPKKQKEQEEIIAKVQELDPIFTYLEENQISYYYMTSLLPIVNVQDLPIGVEDYSRENAELLLQELQKAEVSMLDLRNQDIINQIDKEKLFYKTDHHWTIQTSYATFQTIIKNIVDDFGWNLDNEEKYTNIKEYYELSEPSSFLGSYGIKVGEFYAGKDDFTVYIPDFETNFTFTAYDTKQNLILEESGDFLNALMDVKIMNDAEYNNKYNVFMNNCSVENRITNNLINNDKRILLISHSYGRSLAQYLSLCFKEVRMLDPQEGRFEGNYLQYIEEYQPDLVLFLVEFEGEIIGNYRVE